MKWYALRAVAVLSLSTAVITGCSGSERGESTQPSATSAAPSHASVTSAASARALAAENVKNAVELRISADEQRFGSGVHSPCSTSSPQMFTTKCAAAADAIFDAAGLALREIDGRSGFATLESTAQKLQTAVHKYEQLKCSTGPTAVDIRHACLAPAAVIAQGLDDLRDGTNLGLAGK